MKIQSIRLLWMHEELSGKHFTIPLYSFFPIAAVRYLRFHLKLCVELQSSGDFCNTFFVFLKMISHLGAQFPWENWKSFLKECGFLGDVEKSYAPPYCVENVSYIWIFSKRCKSLHGYYSILLIFVNFKIKLFSFSTFALRNQLFQCSVSFGFRIVIGLMR